MIQERIRELFDEATSLAPEEREAFLSAACGSDTALKLEIAKLFVADSTAADEGFWQRSALHHDLLAGDMDRPSIGDAVGSYRLVELIGRGGMGAVYRAERINVDFEQCVAVKLVDSVFLSPDLIRQFRNERQILASLVHPNIARLLDGGTLPNGLPYLAMEYVEGTSPYVFCRERNPSTEQRLVLFQQMCSAVHFAHRNGVIHRDLKPGNILVTSEGTPKLLDFGIAKVFRPSPTQAAERLTEPGMLKLTARYASPEQVRGETLTTASDIYSLGVILYELLSGHSPYGDDDRPTHQVMHAVCEEEPERPSVWRKDLKGDLDNIVLRAMSKKPEERYSSAAQFAEDIGRYLAGRPVLARGEAALYVAGKFIRRNLAITTLAGLLLCTLVVGLVEVTLARRKADRRFNEVKQLAHSLMFDYADELDHLPGSTPVRGRLVKDALTYLDSLSREANTPQLQQEIVDAYVRVSNIQGNEYENNLGDTKGAMLTARKSVDTAEKLLKRSRNVAALESAANAFSSYGSLLYSTGDLPGANNAYHRALELYQIVAKSSPEDDANKVLLSICLRHLGDLSGGVGLPNLGRTSEALTYYEQAKELVLQLGTGLPANADIKKEGYKTLLSLSAAQSALGNHRAAAESLERALSSIQSVSVVEPDDTNVRMELAVGESRLGQMLLDGRDAEAAIAHFAQSSDLLEKLLKADPRNAAYRRGQDVVQAQWGSALRGAGQIKAALKHNELAVKLAQSLSEDTPESVQYRADVAINERKLSDALVADHQGVVALTHALHSEAVLCERRQGISDPNRSANCGRAYLAAGNAYREMNNLNPAIAAFRNAAAEADASIQADTNNTIFLSDSARAMAALASSLDEARQIREAGSAYTSVMKACSALQSASMTAEDTYRCHATRNAYLQFRSRQR